MFLLVLAYPGSPGQKAVKRLCVCLCSFVDTRGCQVNVCVPSLTCAIPECFGGESNSVKSAIQTFRILRFTPLILSVQNANVNEISAQWHMHKYTRGNQKVLQHPTLLNKMAKINC